MDVENSESLYAFIYFGQILTDLGIEYTDCGKFLQFNYKYKDIVFTINAIAIDRYTISLELPYLPNPIGSSKKHLEWLEEILARRIPESGIGLSDDKKLLLITGSVRLIEDDSGMNSGNVSQTFFRIHGLMKRAKFFNTDKESAKAKGLKFSPKTGEA